MEPACRKDKPKLNSTPTRGDRAKQKSAQQELKQRQRAEVTFLNPAVIMNTVYSVTLLFGLFNQSTLPSSFPDLCLKQGDDRVRAAAVRGLL